MKKFSVLLIIIILGFVSCTNSEIVVSSADIRPFITTSDRMGISLWLRLTGYDDVVSMEVESPGKEYKWSVNVSETDFNSLKYFGSSDIVMPTGVALPQGKWSYLYIFKDGSTYENEFQIIYRNKDEVLGKYELDELPKYDAASNLTIIVD